MPLSADTPLLLTITFAAVTPATLLLLDEMLHADAFSLISLSAADAAMLFAFIFFFIDIFF